MEHPLEHHPGPAASASLDPYNYLDDDLWKTLGFRAEPMSEQQTRDDEVPAITEMKDYLPYPDSTPGFADGHLEQGFPTRSSSTEKPSQYEQQQSRKPATRFIVGDSSSESEGLILSRTKRASKPIAIKRSISFVDDAQGSAVSDCTPSYESSNISFYFSDATNEGYSSSLEDNANAFCQPFSSNLYHSADVQSTPLSGKTTLSTLLEEDLGDTIPLSDYDRRTTTLEQEPGLQNQRASFDDSQDSSSVSAFATGWGVWPLSGTSKAAEVGNSPAELILDREASSPGSDCSWTEANDQEGWQMLLQEQLTAFRKQTSRISLITSPLSTAQRRQVHAAAQLLRLGHMSIGEGKIKRLMLTKCKLSGSHGPPSAHGRWNPSREPWIEGWIDPKKVLIENISWNIPPSELLDCLRLWQLPAPQDISVFKHGDGESFAAYALFQRTDEAASVVLTLNASHPSWSTTRLGCEFLRLPGPQSLSDQTSLSDAVAQQHGVLPSTTKSIHQLRRKSMMERTVSLADLDNRYHLHRYARDPTHLDALSQSAPTAACPPEHMTTLSKHNFASMASLALSDYGSETSVAKKRKREIPKAGGYICSHPACDKTFDRAGDCRKHEKVHKTDRPHRCLVCDQGFMYPKDLRRHFRRTQHGQDSSQTDNDLR